MSNKEIKVVVNARFLTQKLTGVQRFAFELSVRLRKIFGEGICFVAPTGVIQEEMASVLNPIIVGKHSGYIWEQMELPRYLKKHGNPFLLNLCSVAPLFYKKNIIAIHDITWVRYPETYSWRFRMVYDMLIPLLIRKAKHLITVSEFSKGELISHYKLPNPKISVVYNAVGSQFKQISDKILVKENYFLAVSSVKANKNFEAVLKAFEHVYLQNPELNLYIIGDCDEDNFKSINISRYKKNKSIRFLGRVSDKDLILYYSNAVAFVFPSLYEGFGIPVIEAQACGCPVLSSNTSSLPEVLAESALFFHPDDIARLAGLMEEIHSNQELRKNIIEKGYKNYERFTWEDGANKIADMLRAN